MSKSNSSDSNNSNGISTINNKNKSDAILDEFTPASCFDTVKHGRGRPRLQLNSTGMRVIIALAQVMCTDEEIAACLDTTVETLHNELNAPIFSECIKKGAREGKASLRRNQFKLAKSNPAMAIFLGKQYLGQKDNPEEEDSGEGVNVQILFTDTSKREGE